MKSSTFFSAAVVATMALAQRPSNISMCDYYTTALLKNNTAENQYTLLTLVVNTAVIGNYTMPNVGIAVPGILAKGMYNGTEVNLLPYFNGGLASSNRGNSKGVAINFLDGGGAEPLMMNKPANDITSHQFKLLTHLYQYFGYLLGCSMYGGMGFPSYMGHGSQGQVHKFMALDPFQVGYFITQVGLSAASFGVTDEDVMTVGTALAKIFDVRCAPNTTVIPEQGPQPQSICQDESCPLSPNDTCAAYMPEPEPVAVNATLAMGEGRNVTNATSTIMNPSSSSMIPSTGAGSLMTQSMGLLGSIVLLALAL
ncbi:MAG: hypothetical protein M1834_000219 [Cirrosporium novae-zelandiae]|nr:MAG: hypothetical protein M1834_000219 [Cirrosporium novae-zelandiae]